MATFALIHGGFHTSRCWGVFAAELTRRGHRALTVDLPVSDPDAGPDAYLAACVAAFSGEGEPVIVVGHSIAGWTALRLGGQIPVAGTVLLASCITFPEGLYPDEPRPMILTDPSDWTPDERGVITLDEDVARDAFYHDVPKELADEAVSWLVPQAAAGVGGPETPIARPTAPAVYIRCAQDHAVAAPWAEFASELLTGALPRVIDASHSPFLSRPVELAEMFEQIVTEFAGASAAS
jgi:pimeloyl-ACP methyl ester carboxylesterase